MSATELKEKRKLIEKPMNIFRYVNVYGYISGRKVEAKKESSHTSTICTLIKVTEKPCMSVTALDKKRGHFVRSQSIVSTFSINLKYFLLLIKQYTISHETSNFPM